MSSKSIQIERIYDAKRRKAREELNSRMEEVYQKEPLLSDISAKQKEIFRALSKMEITPDAAAKELENLNTEEERLLKNAGYGGDYLKLRYTCEKCQDTGWISISEKKPCFCRLLLEAEKDVSVGINNRETFENFNENIYTDEQQKRHSVNAKCWCEKYADSLPQPEKCNVLFVGKAGLGKSYLLNAIAYRALEKGIPARKVTAYKFVQDAMEAIRDRKYANSEIYVKIPLLLIDDLGSEPVIPNITEETLFSVLNERNNAKLATVIATNLTARGLQERYGDRVMSRITDIRLGTSILLTGENLRWNISEC